ncbi:MAG: dihydropteroate synthase, partial [Bacteroidota bacterium]
MKLKDPINSVFNTGKVINCGGDLLDLSTPKVMGILNVTPDSFYDGGKFTELHTIMKQVKKMVKEGVDIIDVGGQSTRPGAKMIASSTELKRVIPIIKKIKEHFPKMIVSIDTMRSEVAQNAINAGAGMVNDVSAGVFDRKMHSTVAKSNAAYVLMHMKGTPATMQQ